MKPGTLYRMFASWWLFAVLLVAVAATYLIFTLGQDPYPRLVHFLLRTPLGLFLYLALVLNLLLAGIRVVRESLAVRSLSAAEVKTMDVWTEIPWPQNHDAQEIAAWVKGKGFSLVTTRERKIHGIRGRYSFLPGTVMRAGVVILMLSLLISVYTRETLSRLVHEGENVTFFGSTLTISSIEADLPRDFLQVGDDSTFLIENTLLRVSSAGSAYTVTPGFPTRIKGDYFRLIHLGYAQPLAVRKNGRDTEKRADLDILPPGKTHIVDIPGEEQFLTFTLEPDRTIAKGLLKGRQYNLADPYYRIVLQTGRSKSKPEAFAMRPGERRIERALDLSLGKSSLYARLQIVHDPALQGVYLGALIALTGLLLMLSRFFWFRKEMTAVISEYLIAIGYREEFFKKWGILKFYRWKDELELKLEKKG